jgi:hypothetical protein
LGGYNLNVPDILHIGRAAGLLGGDGMSYAEIWETLSKIDTAKYTKQKGKLDYLPWAMAWSILMENYPDASYEFLPEATLPDGSVECCAVVTIEGLQRHMWLPVMDYKNESIVSPTSRQVSDSRMRTLVKTLSLFGLGIALYKGIAEDVPDGDAVMERLLAHNTAVRDNMPSIQAIKEFLAIEDFSGAYEAWSELDADTMKAVWISTTAGGIFTTSERGLFKDNRWNDARKAHHNLEDE